MAFVLAAAATVVDGRVLRHDSVTSVENPWDKGWDAGPRIVHLRVIMKNRSAEVTWRL